MPADSNLPNLPDSPVQGTDLWLINRTQKSYKVTTFDLGLGLIQIEMPVLCPNGDSDCPDGFECSNGICVRIECDINKYPDNAGCPDDYFCWNGFCFPICGAASAPGGCAEGNVCVDIDGLGNYICIPYPFPCDNGVCPNGYTCINGNCYQLCGGSAGSVPGANCPIGSVCTDLGGGISICLPFPFPCGSIDFPSGDECPPGSVCYLGQCVQICTGGPGQGSCAAGDICTDIGNGISVCLPERPSEGFINDGPLIIRTEPFDYPASPAQEKTIFTANQFGRSVLTFQGFTLNPGGPGGGICSNTDDCPPGYTCVGDYCVLLPCQNDGDCSGDLVCHHGFCFPTCSVDKDCPVGYECVDGVCLPGGVHPIGECGPNGECPSGYECIAGYCVPKQCSADGDCPTGFVCYQGYCYQSCAAVIGCPPNHICVQIGPDDFICMPIGGGPDGGGSGGDININIDPDWWNPENPLSPIGDGALKFPGNPGQIYTANQKDDLTLTLAGMGVGDGKLKFPKAPGSSTNGVEFTANQATGDDVILTSATMGVGNGTLTFPGGEKFTANQANNTSLTTSGMGVGNGTLAFKAKAGGNQKTFTANQSGNTDITGADLEAVLGPQVWENSGSGVRPVVSGKHVLPHGSASIGSSSLPWANIYTQDMHFSNEGTEGNSVDGTTGDWTLQEGEDSVYMINNKTGKKYKFLMEEVD